MKKILLILSIALILASCNNDDMENQETNLFIGTWETDENVTGMPIPKKMVFTADKVTCYDNDNNIFVYIMTGITFTWNGTYTYNDTQLIMSFESNITVSYEFKNSILYLQGCPYNKK
jgi:hypothetical protein